MPIPQNGKPACKTVNANSKPNAVNIKEVISYDFITLFILNFVFDSIRKYAGSCFVIPYSEFALVAEINVVSSDVAVQVSAAAAHHSFEF
jgi:hypothetical protein